jgi:hypothetical protein
MATPTQVQEARIALLEHNTSQMQAYKTYILTLTGAFMALMTFLFQWSINLNDLAIVTILVAMGFVVGVVFYSLTRFALFGELVGAIVYAPLGQNVKIRGGPTYDSEAETLIGQLRDFAGHYAYEELKNHRNLPWRWLYNLNIDRREDEEGHVRESSNQTRVLLVSCFFWWGASLGFITFVGLVRQWTFWPVTLALLAIVMVCAWFSWWLASE